MGRPFVLSVHAVDTVAEEGVLSDAAVCTELRCRPAGVVTSVLVARQGQLIALEEVSLALVAQQFEAILETCSPAAARTGILRGARQVELVVELLEAYGVPSLVVAPVLRFGRARVLDETALEATRKLLFPLARVVVARAGDLQALVGRAVRDVEGMKAAAAELRAQGARAVLIAGAVWRGRVLDLLDEEGRVSVFDASRVTAPRIGGLAGAHAAALAAHLARGQTLVRSVDAAQRYVGFRLQRGV